MAPKIRARRSALLSTYGVGGLFPAENASYLIMGLHMWDHKALPTIAEPRLSRQLNARDLKSPPATPDDRTRPNVPVTIFPTILSCPACEALGTAEQLHASRRDLQCGLCSDKGELMPSRFITACRAGHLQDFPYYQWVHSRFPETRYRKEPYPLGRPEDAPSAAHVLRIDSEGRSSALSDMIIRCSCGRHRDLDDAFTPQEMKRFSCPGDRPWLGFDYREKDCDEPRRTLQRGASNAWFAATTSAISIPPYSGRINTIVNKERANLQNITRDELFNAAASGHDSFLERLLRKYERVSVREVASYAIDVLYPEDQRALSEEEFRYEEYKAIIEGAEEETDNQFVSVRGPVPDGERDLVRTVRRISRLREVRALHGFSRISSPEQLREEGIEDHTAELRPDDDPARWVPATELLGEGLFIDLDRGRLDEWARSKFALGRKRHLDKNAEEAARRRRLDGSRVNVDIVKVAIHTFAHMIIDQLALEAGYPSSALRERLYVGPEMAGVLVYTASADSAGSLGGVAAMADPDRLGPALSEAQDRLRWCSADPVCIESTGSGADGANLAACHNCVLLPETSCELFNTQLDRGTLFGTPDRPTDGFLEFALAHPARPVAQEAGTAPTLHEVQESDTEVPPAVHEAAWDDVWLDLPELRHLVLSLIEEDKAAPLVGREIGEDRWPLELVWEESHLAVDRTEDHVRDEALRDEGWTVVIVDPEAPDVTVEEILQALG